MNLSKNRGRLSNLDVRQAYNRWAATYDTDQNLTRDLDRDVTRRVLGDLRVETTVEVGCGTGKNTVLLAAISSRVLALDFSPAMIRRATAAVRADNVSFALADITQSWPCAAGAVDLVVCNLVLEHVADLEFVFTQACAALTVGGRIFVCELHPERQVQGAQAGFQRGLSRVLIPAFVHHVADFLDAARHSDLQLSELKEWWHAEDAHEAPRLVSFLFNKGT